MATRTDVQNKALRRVGVKTPYQAVDSNIMAEVKSSLDDLHETLLDEGLIDWELTAIPNRAVRPLVNLLAFEITDDFGVPDSKRARIELLAVGALNSLQKQAEIPYNGEPAEATYF